MLFITIRSFEATLYVQNTKMQNVTKYVYILLKSRIFTYFMPNIYTVFETYNKH